VKGKIIKMVDKSMHKDPTCVVCGEAKRKNKTLFEVELPCGYLAEVRICRTCTGEEGAMRDDSIELPYIEPTHFHIEGTKPKTFWDYVDTLRWIKDFIQSPEPKEEAPGIHVVHIAQRDTRFFKCNGTKPAQSAACVA
jgi:hypothetical protein